MISVRVSVGFALAGAALLSAQSLAFGETVTSAPAAAPGPRAFLGTASTSRIASSTLSGQRLTWELGNGLPPAFFDSIANVSSVTPRELSPTFVTYAASGTEQSRTSYTGASLSEVHFPTLDVTRSAPAQISVVMHVAGSTQMANAGTTATAQAASLHPWSAKSFSVVVDGTGGADLSGVTKIEAITLTQAGVATTPGVPVAPPNFVLTLPDGPAARKLNAWFIAQPQRAPNAPPQSASINMMADDGTPLFRLVFMNAFVAQTSWQSSPTALVVKVSASSATFSYTPAASQ